MKTKDMALHKEGTAEGYLGIDIQRNRDTIILRMVSQSRSSKH
jgi:hypothetical protein